MMYRDTNNDGVQDALNIYTYESKGTYIIIIFLLFLLILELYKFFRLRKQRKKDEIAQKIEQSGIIPKSTALVSCIALLISIISPQALFASSFSETPECQGANFNLQECTGLNTEDILFLQGFGNDPHAEIPLAYKAQIEQHKECIANPFDDAACESLKELDPELPLFLKLLVSYPDMQTEVKDIWQYAAKCGLKCNEKEVENILIRLESFWNKWKNMPVISPSKVTPIIEKSSTGSTESERENIKIQTEEKTTQEQEPPSTENKKQTITTTEENKEISIPSVWDDIAKLSQDRYIQD